MDRILRFFGLVSADEFDRLYDSYRWMVDHKVANADPVALMDDQEFWARNEDAEHTRMRVWFGSAPAKRERNG